MKVPFIIYADTESLLEKIDTCHCNSEKPPTNKINKHTTSGYSLCRHYRGKDLKEHATKINKEWKKEMIPLTKEENKSYHKQKVYYICKKRT